MPDQPTSNVKIYDRPEKKAPSPLLLIGGVLLALVIAFFLYKMLYHPAANASTPPTGMLPISSVWHNKGLQ